MAKRKVYDEDFKKMIVELYESKKPVCEIKREYGLVDATIYRWINEYGKIKTERCNDTDCYMVELADDMKIWYSKETGLIVREINGSYVYNYYYEFDKVQENDIQKPDTTGCIIPE